MVYQKKPRIILEKNLFKKIQVCHYFSWITFKKNFVQRIIWEKDFNLFQIPVPKSCLNLKDRKKLEILSCFFNKLFDAFNFLFWEFFFLEYVAENRLFFQLQIFAAVISLKIGYKWRELILLVSLSSIRSFCLCRWNWNTLYATLSGKLYLKSETQIFP